VGKSDGSAAVKYHALDILRGLAAVWVFAGHLRIGFGIAGLHPFLDAVLQRGHLGVPMFFVISGYCLLASARGSARQGESAGRFLHRRWRRIYPPFWFSIALIVALPYLIEAVSSLKSGKFVAPAAGGLPVSAFEWCAVATMAQVFLSPGQPLHEAFGGVNSVYWTLAIEVQFYLIVALALACGRRGRLVLWATTALACAFALLPFTYSWGVFLPYWPMFAFGLALFWLLEKGWTPARLFGPAAGRAAPWLLGALLLGCWAAFAFTGFGLLGPDNPTVDVFAFAAVFAVMLWLGHPLDQAAAVGAPGKKASWPVRVLLLTGAMSYSIYLLHTKLCYLVMVFVRQVATPGSVVFYLACLVGTVALCYPFFRFCEKPFMRSRAPGRKPAADAPAAAAPAAAEAPAGALPIAPACSGVSQ
jgi:peptidoglycan/LPS O-acetylase OafA/YrhL